MKFRNRCQLDTDKVKVNNIVSKNISGMWGAGGRGGLGGGERERVVPYRGRETERDGEREEGKGRFNRPSW